MDVRTHTALWSKFATLFGLGFLALFVQAAQAQGPLNYFKNYFVTGDYVVGGVGLAKTAVKPLAGSTPSSISVTSSITLNSVPCTSGPGLSASVVPCTNKGAVPADIIAAFLYWQTIETTSTPYSAYGSFDATFPANPFVGLALGNPQISACVAGGGTSGTSGPYTRVYRADVLKYLPINTTANVRWTANTPQTFTLVSANTGTQFVGATLVVVYRLVTPGNPRIAPLRSVVIYDGAFTGTQSLSLIQPMGGIFQASSDADAKMTHVVGNGQSISNKQEKQTLQVNGSIPQGVPSDPFVGAQGPNWDNYTFNYNLSPNASSVTTQVPLTDDCLSWAAIITSANVQDSDFDGLLDIWETSGLYFDPGTRYDGTKTTPVPAAFGTCLAPPPGARTTCLNLPKMGASPSVPDIFMQIDWMQSSGGAVPAHVHIPQLAALNMVAAAFKARGINLHFDVGNNYQTPAPQPPYVIIPATYAQGGNPINESGNLLCPNPPIISNPNNCAFYPQSNEYSVLSWKSGFDAVKNGDSVLGLPSLFAQNRKDTFHYALFAHAIAATTPLSIEESPGGSACAQNNTCLAGSISGVGDLPGGDLIVTLGLWRSDNPAADQVGTVLEQAGTLMHELGHNLHLHHGGWNNTPVCMADYPSVMNYLYQVAGLTDSAGVEHIDYSYGLELPMSEDYLSSAFPMGLQQYRVRYFAPFNSAINTPGQAAQVFCNGQLLSGSEGQYVRLESPSVSTPDWSNGLLPLGKTITKGLDINYDGTIGETFTDSPDWYSLNLQQVSARPNSNGLSTNVGISDIGISDIGISDIGISDIGISDIGISDIGISDIGISDIGTAALGQDALGDQDYAAFVLSGSLLPPTALTVAVTPAASNSPTYAGGTGNVLNWVGNSGVAGQYNIYRCAVIAPATSCTPTLLTSVTSGNPVLTTFTDSVNNFVQAGSTCPATATCYNTLYDYYVTEVNIVNPIAGATCTSMPGICKETGASSTMSGEVNHVTVVANSQTLTYGAANPTPTFTAYSNVVATSSLTGVTCAYTPAPSTNANGYFDVGNDPITCSGPAAVSGTTEGITYYAAASPALMYPTSLGGTLAGITQGSLTITPLPITVTAVCSTKVYNATFAAGTVCTPANSSSQGIPTITTNSLVAGDTPAFTESYDNPNVGSAHVMTPAGRVNDNNGGNNYKVTPVNSPATSVITPATATISVTQYSVTYDGNAHTAIGTATGVNGANLNTGLNLTGTTHTNAGTYNNDPWTFTDPSGYGNYYPANGTVNDLIMQATPKVTATGNSCTFNGSPCTGSGTATGVLTPADTLTPVTLSYSGTSGGVAYGPTATAPTNAGTYTVTASYAGSANYMAGTSSSQNITIAQATPKVTATGNGCMFNGSPCVGSGAATGVLTPTDTLTPVTLSYIGTSGGVAYGPTATAPTNAGTYTVTASYGGSTNYTAGTSSPQNIAIAQASPKVTATGNACMFSGSPCVGSGTATGVLNPPDLLPVALSYSGTTTNAIPYGPSLLAPTNAGTYVLTVNFQGNTNYKAVAMVANIIVSQSNTTTTINSVLPSPATVGQQVTVTVTVAPVSPGAGTPTGTVTVNSAPEVLNCPVTLSGATGSCMLTFTMAQGDSISATYIGDPNFTGSATSGATSLTVNPAGLTVTPGTFPNGQFLAPYAQAQIPLTINGGVAPYTLSLANNGVVPIGMTLASGTPAAATLSGTPAQAGMWSVLVTVTDSTTPTALTQTVNVPLTIGLATGYAGGNCYMPYPSTPMYYLSNGTAGPWSVTAPGAFAGQMTFLSPGTVTLAGMVSTNGTTVTWFSNQGGQNDQFVTSSTPSSIVINNVTYTVASVNSATSLTLTTSAGVQTDVPYSYTLAAGGNVLTGCLTGGSSGSYQLQLTAGTSAFTLPVQVVAQDTQDNGTVNVNSGGVGSNVPPSSVQQGVVTSGQSFTFLPANYAADSGFNGNALFGFTDAAPQLCGTFGNVPNSFTASQPGRYDIAIDGTTQGCAPIPAFPVSPAPIVFESVDALNSPAVWGSATISNVVLSSGNSNASAAASNVLEIEAGGTSPNPVTVAFNYVINDSGCPGCKDQLQVGLNSEASPQTYAFNGGSSGSGSASVNINVPNTPGRYYIAIDTSEDYGFLYSSPYWWNGQPRPTQYIGVVDVW